MFNLQAIILAGGKGSRLKPYTTVLPKPLLPVGEIPIAEVIVRQLASYGVRDIIISTGHLASLVETYFGDGRRWGVKIRYVREDRPLGTAGAIKLIKGAASDFLVINGDTLTDLNFKKIIQFHRKLHPAATIGVKERTVRTDFGVVKFDHRGELTEYIEKPEHQSFVSMGINVLNRRCREHIKRDESIGMPELLLRLKSAGEKVVCFKTDSMWLDLGRIEDLESARDIFTTPLKNKFLREP